MKAGERFIPNGIFTGVFIADCIMKNSELSAIDKLVWAQLNKYSGSNGVCFPKQETIAENIGVSIRSVKSSIQNLVDLNFIAVESPTGINRVKHMHNKYYFVWSDSYEESIKYKSCTSASANPAPLRSANHAPANNEVIKENHIKPSLCKEALHSEKKTFEPRFIPSAEKLAKIITTKKNIKITPSKINNWSLHLHKLHTLDGVSIRDIDKALNWYSEHINDKYCPHIESGQTFREKYIKLQSAIDRSKEHLQVRSNTDRRESEVERRKPKNYNDPNKFIEGVTKYVKFED